MCITGIEADRERCRELLENSLVAVTAINPYVGYAVASRVAKEALHEYISTARPDQKARCVSRIGWQSRFYIGLNENFGGTNG